MYFGAIIEEVNGEQVYSHHYLIKTSSFEKAQKIADRAAENWYGPADKKEGEWYMHFNGEIVVRVWNLYPTTLKEFVRRMLLKFTLIERID